MRAVDNQFSPKLASDLLTKSNTNIFQPIAKAFVGLGDLVDNQEKKEINREAFRNKMLNDESNRELKKINLYDGLLNSSTNRELKKINLYDGLLNSSTNRKIKEKAENRTATEFNTRQTTIKNKIADNSKLAKLMHSGKSYTDFTNEHGAFFSPATAKIAMDFSNKNKTMIGEAEYKKQLELISTDTKFITDGEFDTKKATDYLGRKLRRGEIEQSLGVSLIDGLHKSTNYGIYKKENKKSTYSPTEATKAYREDLSSFSDPMERSKWRKENPFIEYRDKYNDAKKMSSGVSSTNLINASISNFQNKYKIDDFANYDFYNGVRKGEVSTSDIENLKRVMANSKQAQTLDSQMSKKAGALGEIMGQAQNFARYADSKNVDSNFFKAKVDEIKTFIPGLEYSEKDIENEEFRRDFLNITSTLLKLQSGLTVSDKEVLRFEQSMGTLERNKNTNFIGVKKKLEDIRNGFMGIKAIDPQYFNLKYGNNIRGLDLSLSLIDKAIKRKKDLIIDVEGRHGIKLKVNPFNIFGNAD